ncbi:hypothetical protein SLS55_003687 [Diplodia seriata]|uniref:Uncharacterized protein n=1 Tax=Diplodia seriata TaxID=420778 RepID=A0ABR3CNN5_9PEZI
MSGSFVVEPDNGQDHAFRCTTGTIPEKDLQNKTQNNAASSAAAGRSIPTMRPSTPPQGGGALSSPFSVTSHTSPGSSSGHPSPVSTAPTSVTTSPVVRSSTVKPVTRQLNRTTQAVSVPQVTFDSTSTSTSESPRTPNGIASSPSLSPKDSPNGHFDLDSITLRSLLPARDIYALPYVRLSAVSASFSEPPPLDLHAPTTFGPYQSPHTLSELHERAWSCAKKAIPIEPCLQCRVKGLRCPLTLRSPGYAHLGPLLLGPNNNADNDDIPTTSRPSTTHPRFPACLRCIRAGEADCCIVQRRATPEERAAFSPLVKTPMEENRLFMTVIMLPTDRDVANPALFAEKMRRRDELLREVQMKEERAALAPRRIVTDYNQFSAEELKKIRKGQKKDSYLLGGKIENREKVLKPTESWGEKWVGRREEEEREFVRQTREKADEILAAVEAGGIWA